MGTLQRRSPMMTITMATIHVRDTVQAVVAGAKRRRKALSNTSVSTSEMRATESVLRGNRIDTIG